MTSWKWIAATAAMSVTALGAAGVAGVPGAAGAIGAVDAVSAAAGGGQVKVGVAPDRIAVAIDGKPFTTLRIDKQIGKLYLHPLLAASGKRVTRAFPMEQVAGESTDHEHQRGVWIGAEHVTGGDFWENEPSYKNPRAGRIELKAVSGVRQGAGEGAFTIDADWVSNIDAEGAKKGQTVVTETRTMTFRAPTPDTRAIDIDLRLTAKTMVTFADHHDALLGLRLATPFEIAKGGRVVNAEGLNTWEQLRGSRSAWVDSLAIVDGESLGVAVMDAPANFRFPTMWHVREYALVFASPFASRDYSKSAPDGSVTLKPGASLNLRYRILVHPGGSDVAAAFKEFAGK